MSSSEPRARQLAFAVTVVGSALCASCAEGPGDPVLYTAGHADIAIELTGLGGDARFEFHLFTSGATMDGERRVDEWFPIEQVRVVSSAQFTRPDPDDGAFESLCVAPGQTLHWLPQGLRDASNADAPFLGVGAFIEDGILVDDAIRIALVDVESPSGSGAYALWRDGFRPDVFMSSCDGIDEADVLPVPVGHDHANMGFTEPGEWLVRYQVSGELASSGSPVSSQFAVRYWMEP